MLCVITHVRGLLEGFGDLDGAFHHQLEPHGLIFVRGEEPGEAGVGLEQEWNKGAEHKSPANTYGITFISEGVRL